MASTLIYISVFAHLSHRMITDPPHLWKCKNDMFTRGFWAWAAQSSQIVPHGTNPFEPLSCKRLAPSIFDKLLWSLLHTCTTFSTFPFPSCENDQNTGENGRNGSTDGRIHRDHLRWGPPPSRGRQLPPLQLFSRLGGLKTYPLLSNFWTRSRHYFLYFPKAFTFYLRLYFYASLVDSLGETHR